MTRGTRITQSQQYFPNKMNNKTAKSLDNHENLKTKQAASASCQGMMEVFQPYDRADWSKIFVGQQDSSEEDEEDSSEQDSSEYDEEESSEQDSSTNEEEEYKFRKPLSRFSSGSSAVPPSSIIDQHLLFIHSYQIHESLATKADSAASCGSSSSTTPAPSSGTAATTAVPPALPPETASTTSSGSSSSTTPITSSGTAATTALPTALPPETASTASFGSSSLTTSLLVRVPE